MCDLCINNEIFSGEDGSEKTEVGEEQTVPDQWNLCYSHTCYVTGSEATEVQHGRAGCTVLQQQFKAGRLLCLVISGFSSLCWQA